MHHAGAISVLIVTPRFHVYYPIKNGLSSRPSQRAPPLRVVARGSAKSLAMKRSASFVLLCIAVPLFAQTDPAERLQRMKAEAAKREAIIQHKLAHSGSAYAPAPSDPDGESFPLHLLVRNEPLEACAGEFADFAGVEVFVSWRARGIQISIDRSVDSAADGAQAFREAFRAVGISEVHIAPRIVALVSTAEDLEANHPAQPTTASSAGSRG